MTSSRLEAQAALAHLIACSERYAAAFPMEDGYRRPETLNEEVLGSDLWTAARVRTSVHLNFRRVWAPELFYYVYCDVPR